MYANPIKTKPDFDVGGSVTSINSSSTVGGRGSRRRGGGGSSNAAANLSHRPIDDLAEDGSIGSSLSVTDGSSSRRRKRGGGGSSKKNSGGSKGGSDRMSLLDAENEEVPFKKLARNFMLFMV